MGGFQPHFSCRARVGLVGWGLVIRPLTLGPCWTDTPSDACSVRGSFTW